MADLILADSKDTPLALMQVIRSYLLKIAVAKESPEEVENALNAYEKTGGLNGQAPHFLRQIAGQLTVRADEEEKKAKAAEAEREKFAAARLARSNRPLDLAFTAADGREGGSFKDAWQGGARRLLGDVVRTGYAEGSPCRRNLQEIPRQGLRGCRNFLRSK